MTFKEILSAAQKSLATDIYISPSKAIYIKARGQIKPITSQNSTLDNHQIYQLLKKILSDDDLLDYKNNKSFLTYYSVKEISLYKLFVCEQNGQHILHFQPMHSKIPDSKSLNTGFLDGYASFRKGLIIFSGGAQSGKSHTLNAFLNMANIKTQRHISLLAQNNPWEHNEINSLVSQQNYGDDFKHVFKNALKLNPDMIFIDDLKFENFIYLINNYDFDRPTAITLEAGSAYQFLRKIKNNKLTNTFRNCLYMLFHQKLAYSNKAACNIPIFEYLENCREFDRIINDDEVFNGINYFSELNRKQRGDLIQPIENYLARLVRAELISSQQALQHCENHPYLMKKITTSQSNPINTPDDKTEVGQLDQGWTNIENISLIDEE